LFSLGTLRAAGWVHDAWSTNAILLTEERHKAQVPCAAFVMRGQLVPISRNATR